MDRKILYEEMMETVRNYNDGTASEADVLSKADKFFSGLTEDDNPFKETK